MILELKILSYWLCLLSLSYVISKIEHHFSRTSILFKYHNSFANFMFFLIKYIGLLLIGMWLFIQFTNYFFKGEFVWIE